MEAELVAPNIELAEQMVCACAAADARLVLTSSMAAVRGANQRPAYNLPAFNAENWNSVMYEVIAATESSWNALFFVILYDMFMIPVYLAFSQPPGYVVEEPAALSTFTRLFWTAECIISFNTAYHDHFGQLILDRVMCFKNHLKTWFIVDLLTVGIEWLNIVLAILMENSSGGLSSSTEAAQLIRMARIARIVRMFRLLRILKLRKLIHGFYDQLLGYMEWVQLLLQIGQTLMMVLVLIHAVGCMWYGFSVNLITWHGTGGPATGCTDSNPSISSSRQIST